VYRRLVAAINDLERYRADVQHTLSILQGVRETTSKQRRRK
jgi:hypothetical protein